MNSVNKEIIEAINAFLAIDEVLAFDGMLDNSKNEEEKKIKLEKAQRTITRIAESKKITVQELHKKAIDIVKKVLGKY